MTSAAQAGRIPQWTTADRLRKARDHAGLSQADLSWLMTGDDNGGCAIGDSNAEPADLESPVTLLDVHYTDGWFVTEWPTAPIAA